jgi:hypothetical protein
MDIKKLNEYYEYFNEKYFDGQVNGWKLEIIPTRKTFCGDCNPSKRRIRVCQDIDSEMLGTLLHEMVHAYVGCEHGHDSEFNRKCYEIESKTSYYVRHTKRWEEEKLLRKEKLETELDKYFKLYESEWHTLREFRKKMIRTELLSYRRGKMISKETYDYYKKIFNK